MKMNRENIKQYKKDHPLYSVPPLRNKYPCPVCYDWENCSSSEYGLECRTCAHYNPLRMLYELEANEKKIIVPKDVLLDDCKLQLEKGETYEKISNNI